MIIRPVITKTDATAILSRTPTTLRDKWLQRSETLENIELIHLPLYIFKAQIEERGNKRELFYSVGGILGDVAVYTPEQENFISATDNQVCEFVISESEAEVLAEKYCRGILLEHGLKFKKNLTIKKIAFEKKVYFPFWVGYFKRGNRFDFKAIDGISGQLQGISMRRVFLKAFRQ